MLNPLIEYYRKLGESELLLSNISEAILRLKKGHVVSTISETEKVALLESNYVSDGKSLTPFVADDQGFYFQRNYELEARLVKWIKSKYEIPDSEFTTIADSNEFKTFVNKLFRDSTESIDWQKLGAVNCFLQRFSILSGGPGTGKTTTVAKFLSLILSFKTNQRVTLVAQTGKAATRLKESLNSQIVKLEELGVGKNVIDILKNIQPSTIHRLLKVQPASLGTKFSYNENNLLPHDVVLVDEASMIDLSLMNKLLSAVKPNAKVVLLGDKNQLSPVEAGSVFADITNAMEDNHFNHTSEGLVQFGLPKDHLKNGVFNVMVQLKKAYRFKETSKIYEVSQKVLNQTLNLEDLTTVTSENKNNEGEVFFLDQANNNSKILESQMKFLENYINENDILTALKNINQVRFLCATNFGQYGINNFNITIETYLADQKLLSPTTGFYNNQLVMITKNDYQLGLFNGDVGFVRLDENEKLRFYIEDNNEEIGYRSVPVQLIKEWKTSYAMTIHKSQGSEFNQVIIVLPPDKESQILSKELLYTAITRSTNQVFLYSKEEVVMKCVSNKVERASGVQQRLKEEFNGI